GAANRFLLPQPLEACAAPLRQGMEGQRQCRSLEVRCVGRVVASSLFSFWCVPLRCTPYSAALFGGRDACPTGSSHLKRIAIHGFDDQGREPVVVFLEGDDDTINRTFIVEFEAAAEGVRQYLLC